MSRRFSPAAASSSDGERELPTAIVGSADSPEAQGLIPPGAVIGRYVVMGFLARGAMGEVYVGYDPELDRRLAIKLVPVKRGGCDVKARLLREAQAIAKLSHPNVVVVHDVGTFKDRIFIAMEFVAGGTLNFWLLRRRRSWRDILNVLLAAGRGLQHAHEANLVHRDFKPENVMVRDDGQVRVMDFGLVRYVAGAAVPEATPLPRSPRAVAEPLPTDGALEMTQNLAWPVPTGSARSTSSNMKLTDTGVMMGTPAYMSPEQIVGQTADARSDQFSFCVSLYEALYGVRPFDGATMAALSSSVLNGQVRSPPERSSVPVIVWQTLRRGLSVNAADRYPSMKELLADLARAPEAPRRPIAGDTFASAADLASLLETLLGRAVQAKPQPTAPFSIQGAVAVYAGDDGATAALVHFDLAAAASAAAALTSLPPEVVQAACAAGQLPHDLTDNLREVANVLTGLVRGMSAARLRIHQVYPLPGALPPVVSAALGAPSASLGFEVSIAGYPDGRVTVVGPAPRTVQARHEKTALGRALIVDDSAAMRLVVGRTLRRLGVTELHEASNGEEGLHRLREGAAVDAVFVDWSMPIMDGITFVRAVRANQRFAGVRLVMVTTASEPDQMQAALAAGADEYLVKPISDEALSRKLHGIGLTTT